MYDKTKIDLPASIVARANASIYDYHKGRKSLDGDFIASVFDAQARCELEMSKLNHWPDKNPVIGIVYWECEK